MNNLCEDLVTEYPGKEKDLQFIKESKKYLQDIDKKHAQKM